MNSRFDDLWASAADDGASCPVGVFAVRNEADDEVDQLMNAWLRERSDRIEGSLILEQVQRLLGGIIADGEFTPGRRKRAVRLVRAIRDLRKSEFEDFRA
jgi:hypothetical protein